MKRILVGIFLLTALFLAACGADKGPDIESNMSKKVPDFTYTSEASEDIGLEDFKGKWWIADMIFTNCTTVCIPMTSNMANLQDMVNENEWKEDVHFVSFSVDPDYDTPEVLAEYAEDYGADLSNWTFLTGYDFETIQELSIKTFQSSLMEPMGDDQVLHGTRFYLVNPEGEVVKFYDGASGQEMDVIYEDLEKIFN